MANLVASCFLRIFVFEKESYETDSHKTHRITLLQHTATQCNTLQESHEDLRDSPRVTIRSNINPQYALQGPLNPPHPRAHTHAMHPVGSGPSFLSATRIATRIVIQL